jgi:hypothetical protein
MTKLQLRNQILTEVQAKATKITNGLPHEYLANQISFIQERVEKVLALMGASAERIEEINAMPFEKAISAVRRKAAALDFSNKEHLGSQLRNINTLLLQVKNG